MSTTVTTDWRRIVLDVDPYTGHVTLSDTWIYMVAGERFEREGGVAHFGDDVRRGMDELAFLVRVDASRTLERSPWSSAV